MLQHSHQMHPSLLDPSTFNNNTNPPTPTKQKLQRHVNPSDSSDIWGIDLYVDTLQFLFVKFTDDISSWQYNNM